VTKLILVLGLAVAMTVGATSPCAAQDGKFLLNILEGAEWDSLVGDKPMLLSPTDSRSTTLQVFINPFNRVHGLASCGLYRLR
jgi:hypothetical protein